MKTHRRSMDSTKLIKKNPFTLSKDHSMRPWLKTVLLSVGPMLLFGQLGWSDYIWVYDNEPRNREICDRISKSIDTGDKVVIFPKSVKEKDINDMYLAGRNVQELVETNVYQGLEAKLKFNDWKNV